MNKRLLGALLAIWIIIMMVAMQVALIRAEDSDKAGTFYDGYSSETSIYSIDRRATGSFAYWMDAAGKVKKLKDVKQLGFDVFEDVAPGNAGPAVVASRPNNVLSYEAKSYRIFILNEDLTPLKQSAVFVLPEGFRFTSASLEAGIWYIATVSDDGLESAVYSINEAEFQEMMSLSTEEKPTVLDENKGATVPYKVYSRKSENGLSYIDAVFRANTLYIRTDKEAPGDAFKIDQTALEAYSRSNAGVIGRMRLHPSMVIWFIGFTFAGIAFLLSLMIFSDRHPHISWTLSAVIASGMVMALTGLLVNNIMQGVSEDSAMESLKKQIKSLEGIVFDSGIDGVLEEVRYSSSEYEQLVRAFSLPVTDVLLVDSESDKVIVSRSGFNLSKVSDIYGLGAGDIYKKSSEGLSAEAILPVHGNRYAVFADSLYKDFSLPYILVGIDLIEKTDKNVDRFIWIFAIVAFVLVTFILIARSVSDRMALEMLAKSMTAVSEGNGAEVAIPDNTGVLSRHWEILNETAAVLRRINYRTYQIYEAYFRFAPKKLETILGKGSIAEVERGDEVTFRGTEAVMNLTTRTRGVSSGIDSMNSLLELMEKYQDKTGGVLVSSDMSVGLLKILFKDNAKPVSFGLDFLHESDTLSSVDMINAAVILHYGDFRYGVVGTKEQSMAFMDSAESRLLEKYSLWLHKQGLRLIITESTRQHEGITDNLRYIGYVEENGIRLDLYEVIDANPAELRAKKLNNLAKYNEALEHFRQSNFYFARNTFSEILRDAPQDALVKWYLFESEKYLNQAPGDDLLRINTGSLD